MIESSYNRYEGRQSSRELNRDLYNMVSGFISEIEGNLAELDYEIEVAGSLAVGQAVHIGGGGWRVKDIDFKLTKNGDALSNEEAMSLKKATWFIFMVKSFLNELGDFYSENGIENTCNEADFLYDDSGFIPHAFAIGVNS